MCGEHQWGEEREARPADFTRTSARTSCPQAPPASGQQLGASLSSLHDRMATCRLHRQICILIGRLSEKRTARNARHWRVCQPAYGPNGAAYRVFSDRLVQMQRNMSRILEPTEIGQPNYIINKSVCQGDCEVGESNSPRSYVTGDCWRQTSHCRPTFGGCRLSLRHWVYDQFTCTVTWQGGR
jgi:hypothetical protein